MKPAAFEYVAPATLDEAVSVLAEHSDDVSILAGGQSLVPLLALRLARPAVVVDINRVDGLNEIERVNGHVRVGATVRHAAFENGAPAAAAVPLFALTAPLIGHFQIRNRGTLCGSLTHADPAAEWPAVALTLDAEIEVRNAAGSRRVPARDFFVGPLMTALEPGDLVVAAHFPVWTAGARFAIEEFARRSGDFAIAGAVCAVEVTDGKLSRCAIGLLGMGSTPLRAETAENAAVGSAVSDVDAEELGRLAVADLDCPADIHASSEYRRRVGATVVARALSRVLKEAAHA